MLRQQRKRSILYRYISSYISIVLLSCGLLISFSSFATASRLSQELDRHREYQISLLADNLQRRYEEMESIVLDVAISSEFKPMLLQRSKFYDIDLLEALSRYTDRTLLDNGFFLTYDAYEAIYTPAAKYAPEIYLKVFLGSRNPEQLYASIRETTKFTVISGDDFSAGLQLWCFPMRIVGEAAYQSSATMVFLIDDRSFEADFERCIGDIPGTLQIRKDGLVIYGPEELPGNHAYTTRSSNGLFELTLAPTEENVLQQALSFTQKNVWFLLGLVLVMSALGIFMAVRNYRPIRRVYDKQSSDVESFVGQNELEALERTLDRFATEREQTTQQLSQQLQTLRSQMVRQILSGREANLNSQLIQELGISFIHGHYFVAAVITDKGMVQSEAALINITREMSGPELSCYATRSDEGELIAVLFNAADPALRTQSTEEMLAACRRAGLVAVCGVSTCITRPDRLKQCFFEAASAMNAADESGPVYFETLKSSPGMPIDQEVELNRLSAALIAGKPQEAQDLLDALIGRIRESTASIPLQLYACAHVLNRLVQTAGRMNYAVPPEQLGWLYMSSGVDNFHDGMSEIVWQICDGQQHSAGIQESEFARQIIEFVEKHYLEYSMSLDMLADHFSISSSQISRVFKNATGEAFKDYIVRKRIVRARELIMTENISVAELCSRVGYTNVSHFIKVFKGQVGITPAAYRKYLQDEAGRE